MNRLFLAVASVQHEGAWQGLAVAHVRELCPSCHWQWFSSEGTGRGSSCGFGRCDGWGLCPVKGCQCSGRIRDGVAEIKALLLVIHASCPRPLGARSSSIAFTHSLNSRLLLIDACVAQRPRRSLNLDSIFTVCFPKGLHSLPYMRHRRPFSYIRRIGQSCYLMKQQK